MVWLQENHSTYAIVRINFLTLAATPSRLKVSQAVESDIQGSHIIKLKSFKLHHIHAHINTFHKSRRFAVTAISRTLLRPPNNITFLNDPSCISASVTDRLSTIGSFAK